MRFMTHVAARALPARNQSKFKEISQQLRNPANASLQIRRAGDEFGAIGLERLVCITIALLCSLLFASSSTDRRWRNYIHTRVFRASHGRRCESTSEHSARQGKDDLLQHFIACVKHLSRL